MSTILTPIMLDRARRPEARTLRHPSAFDLLVINLVQAAGYYGGERVLEEIAKRIQNLPEPEPESQPAWEHYVDEQGYA